MSGPDQFGPGPRPGFETRPVLQRVMHASSHCALPVVVLLSQSKYHVVDHLVT